MLFFEVDGDVAGALRAQVHGVIKLDISVISKFILLIGKVHLGFAKDLDVFGEMIVTVDIHSMKSSDLVKSEN